MTAQVYAQSTEEECDQEIQDCNSPGTVSGPVSSIYPFRPFDISYIQERLKLIHEGTNYILNIYEMEKKGLNLANTKVQPWGGSYWPLYQGMIANNYQDKDYDTHIFTARSNLFWRKNSRDYKKRTQEIHPNIYNLSEEELGRLSPSEKYDLILGDTTFDLTNRIWSFANTWGNEKKWGFLSSIEISDGQILPKSNRFMAHWEGICHGWAVAAGHTPRPRKTVYVKLPNGKKLPVYPNDIKALISLTWANSTIQSNVIVEGNRCNRKNPDTDIYGRYIDLVKDRDDTELYPRCADVHPGIFHVSMINILGVEGRSFVVDKNPEAPVSNQPVSGYELYYFNPRSGKRHRLSRAILSRNDYGEDDPFRKSRHPESTHIVGVEVKLKYTDWENPRAELYNSSANDSINDFSFTYDLELNASGEVIGGQWRVKRKGGLGFFGGKTHQPDFFWVVPRNWKDYFKANTELPKWNFRESNLPPKEYSAAAIASHSFIFEESKRFFINSPKCPVLSMTNGEVTMVDCSFRYPRPQPLINVVEKLIFESRR